MGNVFRSNRSWFVVGVINAVVAGGVLFHWNRSAAEDTAAGPATSLRADSTLAQAVQVPRGSGGNPVAEKPAAQPTATSYPLSASENDEKTRQSLAKTVKFEFHDTPLRDAMAEIGKQHDIVVWLDHRALADLNITSDTPVTRKLRDVSLKSALRLLLRPLQLTSHVDAGVLKITSQTEYDNQLEIRVYPVGDLITPFERPEARDEADFDSLQDVIETAIGPTSWDNVGGPGSMSPHAKSLVISQTAEIHEQIDGLLRTLRKVRADQRNQLGGAGVDIRGDERSEAIRQALTKPIAEWEFSDIPLRDALEFIGKQSGVQVQIDERALTDLNLTSDTPVTSQLRGIPLKDALRLLLQPLQLTHVVDNEVLSITSQTEADNLLQIRVYPVGDLLDCESEKGFSAAQCDFDSLTDVISTTVAPTSWASVGGPANIPVFEGALALVISQTQEVHEQIEPLLARMRQAQPRREKTAATSAPEDKSGLTTRVYALWQFGPQRERHADNLSLNPAPASSSARRSAKAQNENLSQFGGATAVVSELGFGGGFLSEGHFAAIPPQGVPAEQAASLIRRVVEPDAWKQPGTVLQAAPNRLVIRQTAAVHKKTEEFLRLLGPWREVKPGDMGGGSSGMGGFGGAFQVADDPFEAPAKKQKVDRDPFAPPATTGPAADPFAAPAQERPRPPATAEAKAAKAHVPNAPYLPSAAELRIREELARPTEFEFNDTPFSTGIDFLRDKHGIEMQIDEKWLGEEGVTSDSAVTLQLKGVSLRSGLRLLLSQLSNSATFVVCDEVLLITTRDGARQRKSVRIYDVSDFAEPQVTAGRDAVGTAPPATSYPGAQPGGVQNLVNVIEQAISPGTWGSDHGSGVVPLVRNDSALLVVHHSAGVQDEIVDLLSSLREMRRRARRTER